MKKKILLLLAIVAFTCSATAQQKLTYAYDASGNRVSRTIVLASLVLKPETGMPQQYFVDIVTGRRVSIYPNQVKKDLTITVSGCNDNGTKGKCILYDVQGRILFSTFIVDNGTYITMNKYPKGDYIMKIELNKEVTTWKIIKS